MTYPYPGPKDKLSFDIYDIIKSNNEIILIDDCSIDFAGQNVCGSKAFSIVTEVGFAY